MKTNIMNAILAICLLFIGCKKEHTPIPDDPPCAKVDCDTVPHKYELVWKAPFHMTQVRNLSSVPVLFGDILITSYLKLEYDASVISAHHAQTGELLWQWEDYWLSPGYLHTTNTITKYNNQLIISNVDNIHAIDLSTGLTQWAFNYPDSINTLPTVVRIGNYLYDGGRHKDESKYYTELLRMSLDHPGIWEKVFSIQDSTMVSMEIGMVSQTFNATGDSILICYGTGFHREDPKKDKGSVHAWNMTKKEFMWSREYPLGDGLYNPPIVINNRIYLAPTTKRMVCLDKESGNQIWEKVTTEIGSFGYGDLILEDNILIACNSFGWIFAIDPDNGNEIWRAKTSEYAGSVYKMEVHKGILYIANGGIGCNLSAWDIHNGENYWCEYSVNAKRLPDCYISANGLTIDKERGLLYTTDGYDILCMKTIR